MKKTDMIPWLDKSPVFAFDWGDRIGSPMEPSAIIYRNIKVAALERDTETPNTPTRLLSAPDRSRADRYIGKNLGISTRSGFEIF